MNGATWLRAHRRDWGMAFGQASGPPASAKQVGELLSLLHDAGHRDLRDARGPMGFTQRQAAGKFTRDEAAAFIDRLQQEEFDGAAAAAATDPDLQHLSAATLAAELQRRGWTVREP
jgi:hypothetical protein